MENSNFKILIDDINENSEYKVMARKFGKEISKIK